MAGQVAENANGQLRPGDVALHEGLAILLNQFVSGEGQIGHRANDRRIDAAAGRHRFHDNRKPETRKEAVRAAPIDNLIRWRGDAGAVEATFGIHLVDSDARGSGPRTGITQVSTVEFGLHRAVFAKLTVQGNENKISRAIQGGKIVRADIAQLGAVSQPTQRLVHRSATGQADLTLRTGPAGENGDVEQGDRFTAYLRPNG